MHLVIKYRKKSSFKTIVRSRSRNTQVKKIKRELEKISKGETALPAPAAAPKQVPQPVPKETKKDDHNKQAEERIKVVESGIQSYTVGQQHLRSAEDDLKSAAKSLKISQATQGIETMQDMRIAARGGGRFGPFRAQGRRMDHRNDFGHNMIEMGTIRRASAKVKEAAQSIEVARRALPNLPFIQTAQVQKAMSGAFFNALLAPGLVGDMMQMQKVKQTQADIMAMHATVVQAINWCTENISAAQAELSQLKSSMETSA